MLHPFVLHYHELHRMMYLYCNVCLTLPMLRLLQSRAQEPNIFENNLNRVIVHWIALAEYFQMSTMCQGFSHFSGFLHHSVLAKLDASSIRVNDCTSQCTCV